MARAAYADPPYPGYNKVPYWREHVDHVALLDRLGHYDGWALSTGSADLAEVLPLCPQGTRVAAWVKRDPVPRRNVRPWYGWEAVLFRPVRRSATVCFDTLVCSHGAEDSTRKGLTGRKPFAFSYWVFELLGLQPQDELDDLFLGSGAVSAAWQQWRAARHVFAACLP